MRWDLFGYIAGAIACLLAIFYAGFIGLVPALTLTSTRYSPGYSEGAFVKIKIGTAEATVRADLGQPLYVFTNAPLPQQTMLVYSERQFARWAVHWRTRGVILSNGVVVEKFRETIRN